MAIPFSLIVQNNQIVDPQNPKFIQQVHILEAEVESVQLVSVMLIHTTGKMEHMFMDIAENVDADLYKIKTEIASK